MKATMIGVDLAKHVSRSTARAPIVGWHFKRNFQG